MLFVFLARCVECVIGKYMMMIMKTEGCLYLLHYITTTTKTSLTLPSKHRHFFLANI